MQHRLNLRGILIYDVFLHKFKNDAKSNTIHNADNSGNFVNNAKLSG